MDAAYGIIVNVITDPDYLEYDDGDTNWAAEEASDADERFENRYMGGGNGYYGESAKTGLEEDYTDGDLDGIAEGVIEATVDEFCDNTGIDMFWDRDGFDDLICLASTKYAIAYFNSFRYRNKSEEQIRAAVIKRLQQGFKDLRSNLKDPDFIKDYELTDEQIKELQDDITKALNVK